MQLKDEPIDIDLYVEHGNPTKKDMKEIADFIKNHKRQQEIKARRKIASKKRKVKKYVPLETTMVLAHEPETGLYVINRPFTTAEQRQFSKIIEKSKKKNKPVFPKIKAAPARKKKKATH